MRRKVAIALGAMAVIVGVWVGYWEAHFWVPTCLGPIPIDGTAVTCAPPFAVPQFAWWVCALCGAGVAAMVALVALAIDRWPEATYAS